jgi:hypothetical protein
MLEGRAKSRHRRTRGSRRRSCRAGRRGQGAGCRCRREWAHMDPRACPRGRTRRWPKRVRRATGEKSLNEEGARALIPYSLIFCFIYAYMRRTTALPSLSPATCTSPSPQHLINHPSRSQTPWPLSPLPAQSSTSRLVGRASPIWCLMSPSMHAPFVAGHAKASTLVDTALRCSNCVA